MRFDFSKARRDCILNKCLELAFNLSSRSNNSRLMCRQTSLAISAWAVIDAAIGPLSAKRRIQLTQCSTSSRMWPEKVGGKRQSASILFWRGLWPSITFNFDLTRRYNFSLLLLIRCLFGERAQQRPPEPFFLIASERVDCSRTADKTAEMPRLTTRQRPFPLIQRAGHYDR